MVADAVRQTRGRILAYEGELIVAYYHSTSCGDTELPEEVFSKDYPYLKSVKASGKLSPYSMWTRRIPIKEIEAATGTKNIKDMVIKSRTATGRAGDIALLTQQEGAKADGSSTALSNRTVETKDLRKMLGWKRLPSTDFSLRVEDDTVVFEGKGYGHGVGLCQWTALEMALEGKSYEDILLHFYPGTTLVPHEDL
jgi:stage II sporulation protein D